MASLIRKGKLNIDEVKNIAFKMFKLFNGTINKFPAKRMILVDDKTNNGGMVHNDYIEFNVGVYRTFRIKEWSNDLGWNKKEVEVNVITEILMTVLHELSHLDQDGTGQTYDEIESANEIRTNQWVIDNQEIIESMIGLPIDNTLYLQLSKYTSLPPAEYKSIWD